MPLVGTDLLCRTNSRFDSVHSFEGGLAPIAFFSSAQNNWKQTTGDASASAVMQLAEQRVPCPSNRFFCIYTAGNLLKRFTIVSRWAIDFRYISSTAESLSNATTWPLVIFPQVKLDNVLNFKMS
jgi:hypothetical protein